MPFMFMLVTHKLQRHMFHRTIDKNLLLIQISTTIDFPLFFHGLLWCALLMILILNRSTCFMCVEQDFKTTQGYCYSENSFCSNDNAPSFSEVT